MYNGLLASVIDFPGKVNEFYVENCFKAGFLEAAIVFPLGQQ